MSSPRSQASSASRTCSSTSCGSCAVLGCVEVVGVSRGRARAFIAMAILCSRSIDTCGNTLFVLRFYRLPGVCPCGTSGRLLIGGALANVSLLSKHTRPGALTKRFCIACPPWLAGACFRASRGKIAIDGQPRALGRPLLGGLGVGLRSRLVAGARRGFMQRRARSSQVQQAPFDASGDSKADLRGRWRTPTPVDVSEEVIEQRHERLSMLRWPAAEHGASSMRTGRGPGDPRPALRARLRQQGSLTSGGGDEADD